MHTALLRSGKAGITEDKISQRAYVLWLKKGRPKGYESEILREAKEELEIEASSKVGRRHFFQKTRDALGEFCLGQN